MLVTWGIIGIILYLIYAYGEPMPESLPWYLVIFPASLFVVPGLLVTVIVIFPEKVKRVFVFFGDEPINGESDDL